MTKTSEYDRAVTLDEEIDYIIDEVTFMYPPDTEWTYKVDCAVPEPIDFRITHLIYVAQKKTCYLRLEMV